MHNTETENIKEENQTNNHHDSNDDNDNDGKDTRFKPGDSIKLIRVRFPGNAKSHAFLVGKRVFQYGQKVVAMSDRGLTVGYINSFPYETQFKEEMLPLRSIARVATEEDIDQQILNKTKEVEAEVTCIRLIEKHKLDMVLTHVEFVQNGKKAVFYFNAPARVDFRGLVKDLVSDLRMRIELRQISVRDRTAALGAIGVCGLQTCCSSFLTKYGNVSIKMAKNQNLALIPSKINGVCGQIKCCIKYEDDVYTEKREKLPREGDFIQTANGDKGKVYRLHILVEQFEMMTDKGYKRRYTSSMFDKGSILPKSYQFPKEFRSINDETNNIIGLENEKKADEDFYDYQALKSNSDITPEEKIQEDEPEETKAATENNSERASEKDKKDNRNRNNRNRNRNRNKNRNKNKNKNNSTK